MKARRQGRPSIPPKYWLWAATVLAVWAVLYWRKTQEEIATQKSALLQRQRAVAVELGPKWGALSEQLERWTMDGASTFQGDLVAPALRTWDFSAAPGIYVRLLASQARTIETIRRGANRSLRDGFTACLFREPNVDPTAGPSCSTSQQCAAGMFCNEADHCTPPAQPFNLRSAYRGTRILTEDWSVNLREAGDDMRLRYLEREFDSVVKNDIPLTIDLMTRAQFFLLVLDEDPNELGLPDGGTLEALQTTRHAVRVFLYGLKGPQAQQLLLRLRREPGARFVSTGVQADDPELVQVQQRQVNNCQLALEVRQAIHATP